MMKRPIAIVEVFGKEMADDLKDARSRWEKIASAAYRFGKEFFTATIDPTSEQQTVFELFFDVFEDPKNEELIKLGAELAQNVYEGLGELWENQQFQGGLKVVGGVVEVGIGKGMVVGGGIGSVITAGAGAPIGIPVAILGAAVAGHGVDQIGTGLTQMLVNEEVRSVTAGAFEELGFSAGTSQMMDYCLPLGVPFFTNIKFLGVAGRSIEMASSAIRRTAQQSAPMFFRTNVCPRMIGLVEKEIYTATNPLKLKQIPASIAKEFERK